MSRRLWYHRRRSRRITGYYLHALSLWHDEGNPRCRHCTYIAGTTIRDHEDKGIQA
jgi:hypothetical protein